jgi:hypothetical protein
MLFDFSEIRFDWLILLKKFKILIYFHSDLVYHTIYFNYKLKFSIFSQIFWTRQTDQSWSQKSQTTFFVRRREYICWLAWVLLVVVHLTSKSSIRFSYWFLCLYLNVKWWLFKTSTSVIAAKIFEEKDGCWCSCPLNILFRDSRSSTLALLHKQTN